MPKPGKHTPFFELLDAQAQPGCSICRMVDRATFQYLDAILYEAVLDPDVRATFAAALAPWAARNAALQGEFVPVSTGGGMELYIGNNPRATGILARDFRVFAEELSEIYPRDLYPSEAERSGLFQRDAVAFIRENPGRFLHLSAVRIGQFWKVYSPRVPLWQSVLTIGSFGLALPLAALHAARFGWRRGPAMLFVVLIASQTAVHAVFTSAIRYRIPIEPLVVALAAGGVAGLLERRSIGHAVTARQDAERVDGHSVF